MADNVYDVGIGTSVDNNGLKKDLNKAEKNIKDFAGKAGKALSGIDFSKIMGVAGGAIAVAGIKRIVGALNEWGAVAAEHQRTIEKLDVVVKASGAAAWTSSKQLQQLATEQSNATGKARDEIVQMQTVMLGFNNITQDVFKDATTAAMGMAAVMGSDLKSAANTLGKALDVPSQGLSALTKQGFRFTEQQKAMVVELERQGKIQEAQRVILNSVQSAYGDAAVTQDKSLKAQTAYNNAMTDFKIIIGTGWNKAIAGLKQGMAEAVQAIVDANNKIQATKAAQAEVHKLTEEQQQRINELQKRSLELQKQAASATGEKFNLLKIEYEEIERQIKIIQDEAVAMNKYTRANLFLVEEQLKAYQKEADRLKGLKKEAKDTGEAWSAAEEGRLRRAVDLYNEQRKLYNEVRHEVELREGNAAAVAAAEAATAKQAGDRATINSLMDAYNAKLQQQINEIKELAKLKGIDVDSLEVQNQILDVQISAYRELVNTSNGLIKNELSIEQAIIKTGERLKERAAIEKRTDEERKKALSDLSKLQEETQSKLNKILEDAQAEADKLYDTRKEQAHQDELVKLRKKADLEAWVFSTKSAKAAMELEREYRERQRQIEYDNQIADITNNVILQKERLAKIRDAEIEAAGNNKTLKEEIKKKYNDEILRLDDDLNLARKQLDANFQEQKRQAEKETVKAIEQAHVEMYQRLLSAAQEYLNAASSIASSISTIWTNNIDYETNEKLKANDKLIQSDEERAAAEKKINIEAAYERYKAELFAWATNVTLATAQAAMAVLNALNSQPFLPMGPVMAALATTMGAMQVAAVISARPKPPRFHTGGVVEGTGEKSAVLKGGEVVQTQRQFQNTMQAINNLAHNGSGGGVQMNVKVENNASNKVKAEPHMTADGLKLVITETVNEGFGNGSFDMGIARQQTGRRGNVFI